jgi:type I restriction enzyme S subunit
VNYGEVHSKFGFEVDPAKHALKCVDESYLKAFPNCLLDKGDFVFADTSEDIDGSGNFTQLTSDTVTFAGYHTIIARPERRTNTRYLAYLFDAKEFRTQIRLAVKGVKVFSITQAILRGADIWVPSDDEQKNIASFLDHETAKIDALIEKQQRLIELLKEKRQAVISHAVTKGLNPNAPMKDSGVEWLGEVPAHWEMKKLRFLGEARNGLTYSPEDIVDEGEGTLVLRSSNVQNMKIAFGDNVYVNKQIPKRIITCLNDILICSRNGSRALIGKNALIEENAAGLAYGAFMMVFRSEVNPYLFWVLNSQLFEYQSGTFLTSTINQLTVENINGFEIPLPPAEERSAIIVYVKERTSKIDVLISQVESSLALIHERRTALISAAVTGKIDVRDWQASA